MPRISLSANTSTERVFPVLSAAQLARVAAHGERRHVDEGELLLAPGQPPEHCFVVVAGRLEIAAPGEEPASLVAELGPGQFSGEANMLSGRPGLVQIRAAAAGELISLSRAQLLALVQLDGELSEIFMRAFLLRRVELIGHALGGAVVVGSADSPDSLRLREFLGRNGHPFSFVDVDAAPDVQELLDRFRVAVADLPVVVCRGGAFLRNPSRAELADCLGFNRAIDPTRVRDVIVVGAGPAGLAAAVYAASEGLDVLILEEEAPGGQAGSSSKIENYLGFPTGVSGQDLAGRAYNQAQKFGAEVLIARAAAGLLCDRAPYAVRLEDGTLLRGRLVVVASGARYRRLRLESLARFEGCGVYYAATFLEAQLCKQAEVVVVGGGNSAGQAAVFLAETAKRVHVLVRSDPAASMSRYLVRRIEESPNVSLWTHTEVVDLHGDAHLQGVSWRDRRTGQGESHAIRHLFSMTGAVPRSDWLRGCVALDPVGFVRTGSDLLSDDLRREGWPLARPPHSLETSRPGVFAVGDVRAGSLKRVASAVGEGATAIAYAHRVLRAREGGASA